MITAAEPRLPFALGIPKALFMDDTTMPNAKPASSRSLRTGLGVRSSLLALSLGLGIAGATTTALMTPAIAQEAKVPTAEDFGRLPAMSSVTISPDGKHMAAVTSNDGKTAVITVWETADLSKPYGIGSHPEVRFMSVSFAKNNSLGVVTQQLFDYGSTRTFLSQLKFTDLKGDKWSSGKPEFKAKSESDVLDRALSSAQIVSTLPNDPENVLVQGDEGIIYKSNLVTGKYVVKERLADKDGSLVYDFNGNLIAKNRVDTVDGKLFFYWLIKNPISGEFEQHFRGYAKDRELPMVIGVTKDPNIVLVSARAGKEGKTIAQLESAPVMTPEERIKNDHIVIYNYDIKAKAFKDVAFSHPVFDANSVIFDHKNGEVVAFTYLGDRPSAYYVDDKLDQTMTAISNALGVKPEKINWKDLASFKPMVLTVPNGPSVALVDFTDDFKTLVVSKSGPTTPPEYYLYVEGQGLRLIGKSRPWMNTKALGEGHLEQFTARDGRPIPAFVFKPNAAQFGPGPYPTIIVPHGGPWARDYLTWDATGWTQYFVARGYAVAEPQYRGSDNWGWAQWTAGDAKWGEEMSDDMDDVALGMVAKGVANKDRLAMHGYSFGGYSAMAAIVRPNPIYKCSISGAGPYTPQSMRNENTDNRFQREFQKPFVGGLDALAVANKASIPILIYHGDRDTNVKPGESREFYNALIREKKTAKYVLYKDMEHTLNTWGPANTANILTMIDTYLKTDCKPGGL